MREVNEARREFREANADLEDSEKCLDAAHKKWEVVDLLDDDEDGESKKRRTVSYSPGSVPPNEINLSSRSRSSVPREIKVGCCGISEVNGTYQILSCGDITYSKEGRFEGRYTMYRVYRIFGEWRISEGTNRLYSAASGGELPPKDGWVVEKDGYGPTPMIGYALPQDV